MKSLIKNGMTMLCLAVIIAVALPADAKPKKDKKPKDWQIADSSLEAQIEYLEVQIEAIAIEALPRGADPGDILYWDGSVWQLTPKLLNTEPGAPPPTLILCEGEPIWSSEGCPPPPGE